jgi:hypothetical protein
MKEIKYTILYCVFVRTFVIPFYYSSGTVSNYGFGSDKLRFRFHTAKNYGSCSTTLIRIRIEKPMRIHNTDQYPMLRFDTEFRGK